MTITLLYTTIRGQYARHVIDHWLGMASQPDKINFVVTTDDDCPFASMVDPISIRKLAELKADVEIGIVTDLPGDCVKGWNLAAKIGAEKGKLGDVLIAIADDFVAKPGWDDSLRTVKEGPWWETDAVVHVSDGYNPDIFTLAILTRSRYQRFGYVFYPGYQSMFCDTEFTAVARDEGAVIEATHLLFEHMHPDCGKRPRDAADLNHSSHSRYSTGRMLFELRQSLGFPNDQKEESTSKVKPSDLAVYVQAIKNDFCLYEVCQRLYEQGARSFFFYVPDSYWSGKPASAEDIDEVRTCHDLVTLLPGAKSHFGIFNISRHRKPGLSRIQVETAARNEALEQVWNHGFNHCIVADGDELWRTGLMAKLVDRINSFAPDCVYTGMIPTVGMPGYPIEGAMDFATIYVKKGVTFSECRSTYSTKYQLEGNNIIHFTATRRTMAEIISKSRESGHYDDSNYDFEGWISKILPNIRPGMTNVHMYKPYNPWKLVRHWSHDEVREIPESLHDYLAVNVHPKNNFVQASPHVSKHFTPGGIPKAN